MDRKTVITHLQIIRTWAEFARKRDLQFITPKHLKDIAEWSADAIALLKEQDNCENCATAIEDRQPIVRCKDCVYFEPENAEEGDSYGRCRNNYAPCQNQQVEMMWFCADGERQDDSV